MARQTVFVDSGSVTGKDLSAVTSTTLTVTIANRVDRVSVLVNCGRGTDSRISSITRDGRAYTLAKRSTAFNSCFTEIWYQANPNADTGNIAISFVGTCSNYSMLGHVALINVDQASPVNING